MAKVEAFAIGQRPGDARQVGHRESGWPYLGRLGQGAGEFVGQAPVPYQQDTRLSLVCSKHWQPDLGTQRTDAAVAAEFELELKHERRNQRYAKVTHQRGQGCCGSLFTQRALAGDSLGDDGSAEGVVPRAADLFLQSVVPRRR